MNLSNVDIRIISLNSILYKNCIDAYKKIKFYESFNTKLLKKIRNEQINVMKNSTKNTIFINKTKNLDTKSYRNYFKPFNFL